MIRHVNRHESAYLYREIFLDRIYTRGGRLDLPSRPWIIDVGANIGLFTMFALGEWDAPRVVAAEPAPVPFAALRHNVGAAPEVWLHRAALGREPGAGTLRYYPGNTMMSGTCVDPAADRELVRAYLRHQAAELEGGLSGGPSGGADGAGGANGADETAEALLLLEDLLPGRLRVEDVPCAVTTLSAMVEQHGIDRIDLLKVDVEGAELEVLAGLRPDHREMVQHAAVEVDTRRADLAAVVGLLADAGLRVEVTQQPDYRGGPLHLVLADR
jgi:hypothetical protein